MSGPEGEARLEKVESALAHVERQVDELNRVILEQGKRVHRLERLLERFVEQQQRDELARFQGNNPPPPHSVIRGG